ncbi:MAG: hypothetical protein KGS61_00675 [Verrucomicrobia bacterium]|nr:hypothetical protein [Verrucomicrobiota bacterium]
MARNRRNQSAAIRFGPALKALLFCLFFGGSGVGYVWQKQQIYELSRERKQCEVQLDDLRRQSHQYAAQLAILTTAQELDARVKQLNLGLGPPQPDQVLQLVEAAPTPGAAGVRPVQQLVAFRSGLRAAR